MRRIFKSLFLVVLCVCAVTSTMSAHAASISPETVAVRTYVNPDGSYVVEEIVEYASNMRASTKTGTKTSTYYTSSNVRVFSVKVTGTFAYTGTSATAESANATFDTNASYVTKSAYTSGRTAYASGTVKYCGLNYVQDVALSCSDSGVLS